MATSSTMERRLPHISTFYEESICSTTAAAGDCCPICLCGYEDDSDAVSIPCNHTFHRQCIATWFKSQLIGADRAQNEQSKGSCPYCRTLLFDATGVHPQYICAFTWVQSLYDLEGTMYEDAGRAALQRIAAAGKGALTWPLIMDIARGMIELHRDYYRIAMSHRVLDASLMSLDFPTDQYQVDVATPDYIHVHRTIRGDNATLSSIISNYALNLGYPTQEGIMWDTIIDEVFESWQESHYPRSNYITLPNLHRLVICAGLVVHVARTHWGNTVDFARLLAHGEQMMLDATQDVESGNLSETHLVEYYRVLDYWGDSYGASPAPSSRQDPYLYMMSNTQRVVWILELRNRTLGEVVELPVAPAPETRP